MIPSEENKSYPIFEPNQVLSADNLNQVFNYLDEQERLTRTNLIGIGIVCGLEISLEVKEDNSAILNILRGCGITSEGYLIIEPEDDLKLASYRELKPDDLDYSPLNDKSTWELFPASEPNTTPLSDNFLKDKTVLLFLELRREDLRNCCPDNCDDKGSKVTATVRHLLVNKDFADFTAKIYDLPDVPVLRLHFSPEKLRDYEQVYKDFLALELDGKTVVQRLAEAIRNAYQILKSLIPNLDASGLIKFESLFASPSYERIQYYYDFLRDLTAAYHELREALLQEAAACLSDSFIFPQHLLLGIADDPNNKQYRTPFSPAAAVTLSCKYLDDLRFLFERLNQMILKFDMPSGPEIPTKITPSIFGLKHLSGKSLPFYYTSDLREQWDVTRKGQRSREILSWHDDTSKRNSLDFDLESYNFFRVEGHIGKKIADINTELENAMKSTPLPISILYLNADSSGDFLERHPAIEHEAGVMRGGTFIILQGGVGPKADLAIGDFTLPYRIEKPHPSGCLCRTPIRECQYEWFDTKQHLSNIARLRYSVDISKEKNKELLAKYYVIVVYRYEIQGQSLIFGGKPQLVKIPLDEIASGQISAIARRLNETFPGGLVFDYSVETNKLIIRYFADQTFRIEWGGLQGNQIRYAYTHEGIYRWQKGVWESLDNFSKYKIICRLRNEYRPEEYELLQEDEYYSAKYPTPSQMPTAEEIIEWEKMIKKRAAIKELPINELLKKIKHLIDETYNVGGDNVQIVLIGSWANGSWVSRNPNENKLPAEFLTLRQKITGKTGPSDIDLLVYSESVKPEDILNLIKNDNDVIKSGYGINIVFGKKDAQKGNRV